MQQFHQFAISVLFNDRASLSTLTLLPIMEGLELLGYVGALFIGLVLGLIGGGGTVLCVPIIVFCFGLRPSDATAYSLFIVGITAAVGSVRARLLNGLDGQMALLFGIPAIVGVFLTRFWLFPMIPGSIGLFGLSFSKDAGVMVLFAALMVVAAISMLRERRIVNTSKGSPNSVLIALEGIVVGVLTGLVGAGGGFLIIPALVVLGKLEMRLAVGTSLLIIALKSLIGFTGDLLSGRTMDWGLLLILSSLAILGIFVGLKLNQKLSEQLLKKAFGWSVLLFGGAILYREIFAT